MPMEKVETGMHIKSDANEKRTFRVGKMGVRKRVVLIPTGEGIQNSFIEHISNIKKNCSLMK